MNNIQKQIILSVGVATALALSVPAVLANPLTPSQVQQVNSGLFRSNSQDFFEEGRRKLDREIEILLKQILTSDKQILEIDENLRSQLCSGKVKISSRELGIIKSSEIISLNTKVREICRAN
ncbi:MAG TPA: hypothetical protein VK211_15710 [Kamptonema sp.]|nr:hypothetical protein [Kamptonema sp.]